MRKVASTLCLLIGIVLMTSCSSMLYYPTKQLHYDPSRYGLKPEEVEFSSADGTKLFGWLFRNEEKKFATRPKAVLVQYHGNGENLSSHYISDIWLLRKGYDLFIFDYRGYGRSEGSPSPEGTVKDGEAALRWVKARYPNTPLVVHGQSLGGAIAMRNVIDLKTEIPISGVVIESSFASYKGVARKILTKVWLTWLFQWMPYLVLSDKYAPGNEIARISPIPFLGIHAESDAIVPFACGEEVYSYAREPKEFWKIPGDGHSDAFIFHGDIYQKKLLQWLDSKLGLR